jgi:hypothetical protein
MAVEFLAAIGLAAASPTPLTLTALALWLVIAYATLQYSLGKGYKRWNFLRTLCWTARSTILLCITAARLSSNN